MRTVYAIQFDLVRDERCPEDCLNCLCEKATTWISEKYQRTWDQQISLGFDGDAHVPREGHSIRLTRQKADGSELAAFEWSYPDDADDSMIWSTHLTVGRVGEEVQAALALRVSSARFLIRPADFMNKLGRPRLLTQVLSACNCMVGGSAIPTQASRLEVPDVRAFVQRVLLNEARVLPVLMISCDPWSERPLVDPASAQDRLLGFAQVALLADKWAAFTLTDHLGKLLSCFNGAARLYWPGLTTNSNPFDHPLYLPDSIKFHEAQSGSLEARIFPMLAGISAFRVGEGRVIRAVRSQLDAARSAESEALRLKFMDGTAMQDAFAEELDRISGENLRFRSDLEEAQSRILELVEELERYKTNMAAIWEHRQKQEAGEQVAPPDAEPDFATVSEALDDAEKQFKDILVVWETATDAAKESRFARPDQVHRALLAIADVGREYFAAKKQQQSIGPWEKAFEKRGFQYALKEHQTTRTKHGQDRVFKNKGQWRKMLSHLTLGGGDSEDCLQIYFKPDDNTGRIDIGYCGKHLPYGSQRT